MSLAGRTLIFLLTIDLHVFPDSGVGSLPEFYSAANVTTPLPEVTDSVGLAVAEELQGDVDVFSSGKDDGVRLRFSGAVYFLSCAGVTCVGALCFVVLRCCCYRPDVYAAAKRSDDGDNDGINTDTRHQDSATSTSQPLQASPLLPPTSIAAAPAHDQQKTTNLSPSTSRKEVACSSSAGPPPPPTIVTTFLDDGTERQSSVSFREVEKPPQTVVDIKRASGRNQRRRATVVGSPQPDVEAPLTTSTPATAADAGLVARNRRHVKPLRFRLKSVDVQPVSGGRPKLFKLLIVIVVWTSAVIGGPLSTVKSYACYPPGSRSFVAGAVVADVVAALACVVAARATAGRGDVSTIIAMTCLGTIVLVYYSALALFSLQPHLQQQLEARAAEMPLFGNTAEMLAVSNNDA